MFKVRLQIQFTPERTGVSSACLIRSASVGELVDALVSAGLAIGKTKLWFRANPRSSLLAALIFCDGYDKDLELPGAVSFQNSGGLLFPINATVEPKLTETQLSRMVQKEGFKFVVCIPNEGVFGINDSDLVSIADLMRGEQVAVAKTIGWDSAEPGVLVNQRLVDISYSDPPSFEQLISDYQDDIGNDQDLSQLPPVPNEPSRGLVVQLFRTPGKLFYSMVHSIANGIQELRPVDPNRTHPSKLQALVDWAAQKAGDLKMGQANRDVSMLRLLGLLNDDPDKGLKFAIPLTNDLFRGAASAIGGGRLIQRRADFSLGQIFSNSAGTGGHWQVDNQTYMQLVQKYRDLARREVSLGRYRRAAYIYGELLKDFRAAAECLATGGYFAEAAVIFKEKLNDDKRQIECLVEDGQYDLAIAYYENKREFELVADVLEKAGRLDEAKIACEKAVDEHLSVGNVLEAANLLQGRLDSQGRAFSVLEERWSQGHQSRACLRLLLNSYLRQEKFERAIRFISDVPERKYSVASLIVLVDEFSANKSRFEQVEVQDSLDLVTQQVFAETIERVPAAEMELLSGAYARLFPEDKIFQRDSRNYPRSKAQRAKNKRKRKTGIWQVAQSHALINVLAATSSRYGIFVAGFEDSDPFSLQLLRWQPGAGFHRPRKGKMPFESSLRTGRLVLAADWQNPTMLAVESPDFGKPKSHRTFNKTDATSFQIVADQIRATKNGVLAACFKNGILHFIVEDDQAPGHRLMSVERECIIRDVMIEVDELATDHLFAIETNRQSIVCAIGNKVLYMDSQHSIKYRAFETFDDPCQLACCPQTNRIAVGSGEHVHVSQEGENGFVQKLHFDHLHPVFGFIGNGDLAVVCQNQIEVYRSLDDRPYSLVNTIACPANDPVKVLRLINNHQFVLVDRLGDLFVFEVS